MLFFPESTSETKSQGALPEIKSGENLLFFFLWKSASTMLLAQQ